MNTATDWRTLCAIAAKQNEAMGRKAPAAAPERHSGHRNHRQERKPRHEAHRPVIDRSVRKEREYQMMEAWLR